MTVESGPQSGFTLLFVDDETAVLSSLRRLFHDEGHRVLIAESGAQALAMMEEGPVHLIVSDYRMPGMDGLQLLHAVKERWPETIRVMLTGYADVDSVMDDISAGVIYRFISKPWDDEEIRQGVRLALQQYTLIQEIKRLKGKASGGSTSSDPPILNPEQLGADDGGRYTLLFVDDEEMILGAVKRIFEGAEYRTLTAENGEQALAILAQEPVHLIVSDYRMPGMNGLELLRKVRERWPETIRVMLTGQTDVNSMIDDIGEGVIYKFISKPWQNEELKMAVKLALRQYALIKEIKRLGEV